MAQRTFDDREHWGTGEESNVPVFYEEDDCRRAFPLAAAAFGMTLLLFVLLIVSWIF